MKTAVIMKRELLGSVIRQDSKTCMFNAGDLHTVGNISRANKGLPEKQMAQYFTLDSTKELIDQLFFIEGVEEELIKKSRRGKDGGTWVHPIVFVDMAMWYSAEVRVHVLKWVVDGLISFRNESGDSYKAMWRELNEHYGDTITKKPILYRQISSKINEACGIGGDRNWQTATEAQLKLRDRIHNNIMALSGVIPSIGGCVTTAIKKAID